MGKRILVIEDEVDLLKLIEFRFGCEGSGFILETAKDGDEALQKIFALPPDLILLDIMLPKVNGQEVLRLVRKNPKTAKIPVIIITALPAETTEKILMNLGATEFLEKPIDPEKFHQLVETYLKAA